MAQPAFDPDKYLAEKTALASSFDPDAYLAEKTAGAKIDGRMSTGKAALVGLQEGATMGAKPFVAGVAGGLGQAVGTLQGDGGLMDRIQSLPSAFSSGFSSARKESQDESVKAAEDHPTANMIGQIGGTLLTAPLTAVRGVQTAAKAKNVMQGVGSAAKIGGAMGAAQAAGHAENANDAIEMVGSGMALGGTLQAGGNAISKYGKDALAAVGRGASKIASNLTGISENTIQTYAKRAAEVSKMMKDAGDDIPMAADKARQQISQEIQVARQKLNQQIGAALEDPRLASVTIDASPILKAVDDEIAKIGKVTALARPGEINELKNVRDLVTKVMDQSGKIGAKDMHELKQELQIIAKGAYSNGAVIFPKGDLAAKGAKAAAGEAKRLIDVAIPEVKAANRQLSSLHNIESNMNKNLIRSGKPEAALIAAGGGGSRNAATLKALDRITGGTALQQAENLAAAKTFGNISLNPIDATGKAVARMATGAGVGYVTGGEEGAMIGTALTSPAALKLAIDGARFAGRLGSAVGGGTAARLISEIPRAEATAALTNQALINKTESKAAQNAVARRLERFRGKGNISKPGAG